MGVLLRLLLLAVLAYVLWRTWQAWRAAALPPVAQPKAMPDAAAQAAAPTAAEKMVACAHCGLHVAQSQALSAQGRYFCSSEHLP